jgi:hypothetical protein
VSKQPGSEVADQSFLGPNRYLARGIAEHILDQETDGEQHHQAGGRLARRQSSHEWLDQPVHELLQPGGTGPELACGTEQMLEEGNQNDQGESIEE